MTNKENPKLGSLLVGLLGRKLLDEKQAKNPAKAKKSLFSSIFGTAIFANKWQKAISEERQAKIIDLFTIPRDEIYDVYKPNSQIQTQIIIEQPLDKPLNEENVKLMHEIATNYDYCCNLDVIDSNHSRPYVSHESQEQLDRLPTWLRFLILYKYDIIHERFGNHTHHFLKMIANKIDGRRTTNLDALEGLNDEDFNDNYEITARYELTLKDVIDKPTPAASKAQLNKKVTVEDNQKVDKSIKIDESFNKDGFTKADLILAKRAIAKWRLPRSLEQDWAPNGVHRAALALRRALMNQPAAAEVAMVQEDEKLRQNQSAVNSYLMDDDGPTSDGAIAGKVNARPSWEDIVADKAGFREEVALFVEEDLHRIPPGLAKEEREEEIKLAEEVVKKNAHRKTILANKQLWDGEKKKKNLKRNRKSRKISLEDRACFRKYSRIWHKNCSMDPIKQARRLPHHYRFDESFHAYVVALVGSSVFKNFIMFIIIANALLLAVETGEIRKNRVISIMFEVFDILFLSVYLIEFILKVYAHPYRYWTSGFNIFDAFILIVSLVKTVVVDWLELAENISFLKVLVIVRALRILRGISMSIQIQVLITALVETLKTHVLSVLILLFLLMYIASIIAFYLFSDIEGLHSPWGSILSGMLRLFSFVTMDGWTDTSDEFEKADRKHTGRVFCLICILLGNFLISNIFIAIIIMQISEATESFRSRQRDEREEIIALKKEIVFRRQKLDMRQLLAKQNLTSNADFYYLGSQFLKLLRHDDLVDMNDVAFSPLWMDAFYKAIHRCHHTVNLLMNLHRQMADNLLEMYEKNKESKYTVEPIRRNRYNRYMKLKSKLTLLRNELFREQPDNPVKRLLQFRMPSIDKGEKTAKKESFKK